MSDTGKLPSHETVLRMDLHRTMLNAMKTDSGALADIKARDITVNGGEFRAMTLNNRITYTDLVQMAVDPEQTDTVIEDSEDSFAVTYFLAGDCGITLPPGATMILHGGEVFTVVKSGGA